MENETQDITSYELSRAWWDWCYENPEKVSTNHGALYFFIIEHCNRLGWKKKFGLPSGMAKEAIGIRNYRTYTKTLNDLIAWDFIKMIEKSKNQYSSNIICLSLAHVKNTKAPTKALSKAMQKHLQKQVHGIATINKPINQEPITYKPQTQIFDFSFEKMNPLIIENFKKWILYRDEIGKPFSSQLQVDAEYENLMEISKSNAETVKVIINRCIGSGWQSLQSPANTLGSDSDKADGMFDHIYSGDFFNTSKP